jgi:hypothetical protein
MHRLPELDPGDPNVHVVSVGDGTTPRTAATFAVTTTWQCHSVDPRLRFGSDWDGLPRLHTYRATIEEVTFAAPVVVVVMVHAHVTVTTALRSVQADRVVVVAMPCCVPPGLEDPVEVFRDPDVASPANEIAIWRFDSGLGGEPSPHDRKTSRQPASSPVLPGPSRSGQPDRSAPQRPPTSVPDREEAIAGLRHPDPSVRIRWAKHLDHHFDPAALPALIENLTHPNARVRQWSLHALGCDQCKEGSCRPDEGQVVLLAIDRLLTDRSRYVRQAAAALLGPLVGRRPEVIVALEQSRDHDPHPVVRDIARRFTPGNRPFARVMRREMSAERRDR